MTRWPHQSVALLIAIASAQAPANPVPTDLLAAVKAAYQREFGEIIERPAIYDDPESIKNSGHLTSTAYLRGPDSTSTLLSLYISPSGEVLKASRSTVLTPAGKIRVLVLLVRHPETVGSDGATQWKKAQEQINEDHVAFANSRGYDAPIVVFDNTNLVISPTDLGDLGRSRSVRAAAERLGTQTREYQIVMAIDINPAATAGGTANPDRSVYLGNFGRWQGPLNDREWKSVANAAYHHEVAHHWGWPGTHDWAVSRGGAESYRPFFVPPVLFGWESGDGGRVPEILRWQ